MTKRKLLSLEGKDEKTDAELESVEESTRDVLRNFIKTGSSPMSCQTLLSILMMMMRVVI